MEEKGDEEGEEEEELRGQEEEEEGVEDEQENRIEEEEGEEQQEEGIESKATDVTQVVSSSMRCRSCSYKYVMEWFGYLSSSYILIPIALRIPFMNSHTKHRLMELLNLWGNETILTLSGIFTMILFCIHP